jgi:hypothetical protein
MIEKKRIKFEKNKKNKLFYVNEAGTLPDPAVSVPNEKET